MTTKLESAPPADTTAIRRSDLGPLVALAAGVTR